MQSSLHLSDLSSTSFSFNKTNSPPKQSLWGSHDTCKLQFQEVQEKRSKVQQYSQNLKRFENKLNIEKRKGVISKKRSLDQINDEMNLLATKFIDLQQKGREIKEIKEKTEKNLSDQMFKLFQLEDELRQLNKKNDWAETTFSKDLVQQEDEKPSIQILKLQSEIEKLDSSIRNTKQKIFHYQKEMIKISEAMSPTKFQQHQLLNKIDDFNSSQSSSNSTILDTEEKRSFVNSIEEKRFLYTKTCLENQIKKIQTKIKKIDIEKDTLTEKILGIKAILNESVLNSITEQIKHFKDALRRKERLYEEKLSAAHTAISKELDIKIEKDNVHNDLIDVKKQIDDIKAIVDERNNEISRLEKICAVDEDFLAVDSSDGALKSLIRNIQEQRSLNVKLEEDFQNMIFKKLKENDLNFEPTEILNDEIDQSEIEQVKFQVNESELSLANELNVINQDILFLKDELDKTIIAQQEKHESIQTEENNITDNNSSNKEDSFSIKIQFNNEKINELEKDISKITRKKEKKIDKINNIQNQINNLILQLDLSKTYPMFATDFFEKYERSIGWLSKAIKKQIKIWRSLQIFSLQTIDEWDTKVLLASTNEADDLYVRFSGLKLSRYIYPNRTGY